MAVFLTQHSRSVGEGKTPGRLLDLGSYPGMVEPESPDDWVQGDIFEVEDVDTIFSALDQYEGCVRPNPLYDRRQTPVKLSTGNEVTAWYYHFCGKSDGQAR